MRPHRTGFSHFGYLTATALLLALLALPMHAQAAAHLIVVSMVGKPGGHFAFEPAVFSVRRGDTVRFVQASAAPHNVHFKKVPKGAMLGAATVGRYVIGAGTSYDLVINAHFVDGIYEYVCDPHESVGMKGTMTVETAAK